MNLMTPISKLMTRRLITVGPETTLQEVKELFEAHGIHHLPVVQFRTIIGMISHTDLLHFLRGFSTTTHDALIEKVRLNRWTAREVMTTHLAKVNSDDTLRTAVDVFALNRFHALPVVDDGELVGILTTTDIFLLLAGEEVQKEDYLKTQQ